MGLKDLFYKAAAGEIKVPSVKTVQGATMATNISIGMQTLVPSVPVQVDPTSSDEFDQYLAKIMDDANLPGPDYYEFSKALDTLKSSPLTNEQKYVTIFAGFGVQGITPQSLIDTANKYLVILAQKRVSEFDASVHSAELAIKNREDSIKTFGEENVSLSQKIADNAKRITELTEEGNKMRTKVEIKKTTFTMSYNNLILRIKADIENIKTYLINGSVTK